MSQPKWEYVQNFGDVGYLDYGSKFLFVDATGVYAPEMEILDVDEPLLDRLDFSDNVNGTELDKPYTVYRFILEPCTFINSILSDNPFHPDHPVWFADKLQQVSSCCGISVDELIRGFCSNDAADRAVAYLAVVDYFGQEEFDSYPLQLTRVEGRNRYAGIKG